MQVTFSQISNTQQGLEVEISSADFEIYLDKAAASLSEGLDIQGFRKGRAPRSIVEKKVGSSELTNEAAEIAVRETSAKVVEQANADIPKQAVSEVQVVKLAPKNPFLYKIVFSAPFFELTDEYQVVAQKAKESRKKETVVEEKEIDETLAWLAKSKAKDKPAKSSKGESEAERSPKVDDEFAQSLGSFKNLEELKNSIREGIRLEKEKKEKDRIRLLMIKEIVAKSKSEIPQGVIARETDRIEEEFRQSISQMGLDFEEYLQKIQKKREDLRQGWREQAQERVEITSALSAIAEKEGVTPSEEKVGQEAQKVLSRYATKEEAERNIDPARLRAYVYDILQREKTFEFLEKL